MSNIKIDVEANTNPAKQSLSNLQKNISDVQKNAGNIGVGANVGSTSNPDFKEFASKDDNVDDLTEVIKKLSNNIDKLGQNISSSSSINDLKSSQKSSPTPEVKGTDQKNESSLGGLFSGLTKGGFAIGVGKAITSYFNQGSRQAANYEKNALDIYNRVGVYGNDFNRARKEASDLGKNYGVDTGQVMGLQDTIMRGGFYGNNDLQESSKDMMETSLAFGINSNTLGSDFAELRKRSFDNISSKDYTDAIGTNVAASGMKGREDEVARSLADITDIITKGKLEVTSSDFEMAASLQAQLARQNPALKGDKAAELVGKMQGGFNAKDTMTLRMFGYGEELGYGTHGLYEARKRAEQGFSNPEGIASLSRRLSRETHGDTEMQSLWLQDHMGVNTEEADEIVKLLNSGGPEDFKTIQEKYGKGGDKQEQLDFATSSKALEDFNFQLNKAAANMDAGNKVNEITAPAKRVYNNMPGFMQGGTSMMGQALVSGGLFAAGANIPRLLLNNLGKGAKVSTGVNSSILGSASKGVQASAKGSKVLNVFSKFKNPTIAEEAGNVGKAAGFVGKNAGKITKGLGIAGTAITVGTYGYEAYKNFKKGDNREGFGSIGAGVGTLGGGLAGAKVGAAAGTLVGGPIGTLVGGAIGAIGGAFAGDKIGRKAGRGVASLATVEANSLHKDKKDKDLVSRKELVVKREEQLLDRLEAGDLFNINIDNKQEEKKKYSTGTNKKDGSSYADKRNQYAFNKANGLPVDTGPLQGSENFDKIWNYFKKQGFSDSGTAGIMANLQAESGLNPAQKQHGGGPGRGLAQWEGPRFDSLVSYANSRGTDWTDLKTQLDFLMKEMSSDYSSSFYDSFKTSSSAWQSAADFENIFERPAQNHNAERGRIANQILEQGKNVASPIPANPKYKPKISSYAIGTDRVPEDQLAFIHKDEAVLSKFDAKEYRENNYSNETNGTLNLNVSINGAEGDMEERLKAIIMSAIKQFSTNQQKFKLNQVYQRKAR